MECEVCDQLLLSHNAGWMRVISSLFKHRVFAFQIYLFLFICPFDPFFPLCFTRPFVYKSKNSLLQQIPIWYVLLLILLSQGTDVEQYIFAQSIATRAFKSQRIGKTRHEVTRKGKNFMPDGRYEVPLQRRQVALQQDEPPRATCCRCIFNGWNSPAVLQLTNLQNH